jgi:hypothetical protein
MIQGQKGFVAILGMLVAAILMAWIVFARYETKGPIQATPQNTGETKTTSYIETRLNAVDAARAAKESLEKGWGPTQDE